MTDRPVNAYLRTIRRALLLDTPHTTQPKSAPVDTRGSNRRHSRCRGCTCQVYAFYAEFGSRLLIEPLSRLPYCPALSARARSALGSHLVSLRRVRAEPGTAPATMGEAVCPHQASTFLTSSE